MFELPAVQNSKRIRTIRKLRYQYINALHREHAKTQGQINADGTLPTPENSAAEETSDVDADRASTLIRKRRKRRSLSILGCADSDSELSDTELQDPDAQDDPHRHHFQQDSEKAFYARHEKPQETFESWNTDRRNAVPMISRTISYADCKHIERSAHRRTIARNTHISQAAHLQYSAIRSGQEVFMPPSFGYHSVHYHQLSELLHLSILSRNWENAYRCFSVLIRLPGIDVRSLWGAGVAILDALSQSKKGIATSTDFLGWLSSIYTSRSNFNHSMNLSLDPVFRSGSKTHTAKFVISWLWETLFDACSDINLSQTKMYDGIDSRLPKLMEKLSEMILAPPYMEDPEVWFIYAVCHLVCADKFSERFCNQGDGFSGLEKDIARNQVVQHITNTQNCLKKCMVKGADFNYPERFLQEQLASFEKRLYFDGNADQSQMEAKSSEDNTSDSSSSNLDTQELPAADLSSFINEDEDEDYFGRSERVHFGFDSDESSS
ncbi:LAME_0D10022g1_1 [Lachancea meyersii CBS 8951]|uniref:LAME_0D10022g1_1 n=1 Tax=Lachancea meyersii CBS 8951 TaxID=1266667 RepID=A0A1G4JBI2_9SACH|nr:LAME_0D10022g1_1 [Lachancea meyersii CBS 8951]